jgi:uncharacterized protein YndB with AHSA1/START domain
VTNLATFVDRYTMKHVRVYPHPTERVWEAITDPKHVSTWLGFPVTFELRVGGRCIWGVPPNAYFETEIARLEPTNLVEHTAPNDYPTGGFMRFELRPHADGCRFEFTQHFVPGTMWDEVLDDLGGDLPGGPDTPWRPGFVGGWHQFFDMLGNHLDGRAADEGFEPADPLFGPIIDNWIGQKVAIGELAKDVGERYARELRAAAQWNDFNEIYRKHIRETIPSE